MTKKGEEAMLSHSLNRFARDLAIEQSLDAAIEISDVITGKRSDSPALSGLIHTLMGADAQGVSPSKRDLLSDSQFTSISQRAAALSGRHYTSTNELSDILDLLLKVNSVGLTNFSADDLNFIRDFCLGLNQSFVSEAFSKTPEPPLARSR
jgi:hypothetical protein